METVMTLKARCHCGATQFELTEAPTELADCNCSFCSRRGALHAYYKPAQFKLTTARDRVSTYQWGHYLGQHHHCGVCGCPTYSEFPSFDSGEPNFEDPRDQRERAAAGGFRLGGAARAQGRRQGVLTPRLASPRP
jgi:hypothetical protein